MAGQSLGQLLRKWRLASGFKTQTEAAEALSMSRVHLSNLERGKTGTTHLTLARMALAYKRSPDDFDTARESLDGPWPHDFELMHLWPEWFIGKERATQKVITQLKAEYERQESTLIELGLSAQQLLHASERRKLATRSFLERIARQDWGEGTRDYQQWIGSIRKEAERMMQSEEAILILSFYRHWVLIDYGSER